MDDTHTTNAQAGSRKRLKISPTGRPSPAPPDMVPTAPMKPTAHGESSTTAASRHGRECHHESALKTLHTDLDAMRSLVTCQICHRFMYEPYAVSCGHTYCYSCLSQWFADKHKKTCPDCRTVITQQPTPSYVLREMVLIFASRNELLPDGETAEDHKRQAQDEADLVARDKADTHPRTGGLFKGGFGRFAQLRRTALHDTEDGVMRCAVCHWEVEDGFCVHCNRPVGEDGTDYGLSTDDELDHDFDDFDGDAQFGPVAEDDVFGLDEDTGDEMVEYNRFAQDEVDPAVLRAAFGALPLGHMHRSRARRDPAPISSDRSEDESSEDEDDDDDLDGFVVDDDEHEGAEEAQMDNSSDVEDDEDTVQEVSRRTRPRGRGRVLDSDEDEEVHEDAPRRGTIIIEDSEDDEAPVLGTSSRVKRNRAEPRQRQGPIAIPDEEEDESSSEESSGDDDHAVLQHMQRSSSSPGSGFSPLQPNQNHDDDNDAVSSVYTGPSDAEAGSEVGQPGSYGFYDFIDGDNDDDEDEDDDEDDLENRWADSTDRLSRIRENTLVARSNWHVEPSVNRGHRLQSPPPPIFSTRRPIPPLRDQAPSVRSRATNTARRIAQPTHPFNLSNTLASINGRRHVSSGGRSSSASSTGGVDVYAGAEIRGESSSSSGSSRTIGRTAPRITGSVEGGWRARTGRLEGRSRFD